MADKLIGPEKAAVLLLALGDKCAVQIIKNLENHEIQRLGVYMTKTKECSLEQIDAVVEEYHNRAFKVQQGIPYCDEEYVKRLVLSSLGAERAQPILEKLSTTHQELDLSFVREIEPATLVNFIKLEHPQTIALILSYMSPPEAAEALALMSEDLRPEVVMRMGGLDTVDTTMIEEIASVLEREVRISSGVSGSHKVSGLETVAEIMNNLDQSVTSEIFSTLEDRDQTIVDGIRELMFVFEDLLIIDDRGIQSVLKNIDNNTLTIALKTASDEIKEKIFKNMSTRASQMIQDEMDTLGPLRLSEVEAAQKQVAAAARQLGESGEIVISKGEGEDLVV